MTTKRLLQLPINALVVFLVLFATVGVNNATAQATWNVNNSEVGASDNNDGSQMNNGAATVGPLLTIAGAVAKAVDGDTIRILSGTYGEGIDNAGLELTFQVESSGINTIVFLGGDVDIDDNTSFSGGDGTFEVIAPGDELILTDGVLTLDASILELPDAVLVTVFDGSLAGSGPVYAGEVNITYDPDDGAAAVNLTTGLEVPTDGDLDGGTLTLAAGWGDGSLTIDRALTTGPIDIDGDADATFQGAVTASGTITAGGADGSSLTFDSTVDGTVFLVADNGDVTVTGASTMSTGYVIAAAADTGVVTFTGASTSDGDIAILGDDDVDFVGLVTMDGGDFDHSGAGDVTTGDVNLTDNDLDQTAGTFTMSSTLTIGQDGAGVSATRVSNAAGATMTIDNIVIERTDTAADDTDDIVLTVDNSGTFTLSGTITEGAAVDDDGSGGEDLVGRFALINAAAGFVTFESSTSFTGDIDNGAASFDNTAPGLDGIAIPTGVTVDAAFAGAFTDLGFWGGAGTLEISTDGPALTDLESMPGFVLSGVRAFTTVDFDATGNVDIQADGATIASDATGTSTVGGSLTISGDGVTWDDSSVGETLTTAGLSVTGTGFRFGDGDDTLTSDGDSDLGDGTVAGDLNVDDGDFSTDGGAVTGDFDVDGGDASLDGAAAFGGTVNVEGNVTVEDGAAVGFVDLGVGVSDVGGALTVNGVLATTDATPGVIDDNPTSIPSGGATAQGTDFTVGSLSIAFPDGELAAGGVDIILNGSFVGGLFSGPDDFKVIIPSGGTSFTPGPNFAVDFFTIEGSGRTLTVGEGFEVDTEGLYVQNDASLALGDNTVTISGGDLILEDEATVTTSGTNGAVTFADVGGGQSIDVTGAPTSDPTLSNIRINAGTDVTVLADIDITGDVSLNDGTFIIAAGVTVNMTGSAATITRNPEGGAAGGVLTVTGTLAGAWDVVYFGDGPGTTTGEFSDGQTRNVTVQMDTGEVIVFDDAVDITGNFTVTDGDVTVTEDVGVAGDFSLGAAADGFTVTGGDTFDIDGNATFSSDTANAGDINVGGDATIDEGVDADGFVNFDGTGTVTLNGTMSGTQTFTGDYTVNASDDDLVAGSGELGVVVVDGGATVGASAQATGDVTVTDGALTLTMVDDGDTAGADANDMFVDGSIIVTLGSMTLGGAGEVTEIDDIFVDEGGSFTLATDADSDGAVDVGDAGVGVASFDIGSNNLEIGGAFTADDDAVLSGSGVWEMDGGGDVDINELTLVNLTLTAVGTALSDLTVSGTLLADEDMALGGNTFFLSGDATFAAGFDFTGGEFQTTGTTLTLEGDVSVDDFTVNSSSTTTLADDGSVTAPYDFTVSGTFNMAAGTLDLGDQVLDLTGGVFDYDAGTISMDDGHFEFSAATAWDSDDNNVSLKNIESDSAIDLSNDGGDGLTVTGTADLNPGAFFVTDDVDPLTTNSTVSFADGSSMVIGEVGGLALFQEDPTLGADMGYTYDGAGATTTGNELEDGQDVADFNVATGGTLTLEPGTAFSTDALDLDAAFDNDGVDSGVTINDGGTVFAGGGASLTDPLTYTGSWNLTADGIATLGDSDDDLWPDAATPATFHVSEDVDLSGARTAGIVLVDATETLFLDGVAADGDLTATGDVTVTATGTVSADADNVLVMGGTTMQTLSTGGANIEALEIDNEANVTLSGGDLSFSDDDPLGPATPGTLILTDGILFTGDNKVTLKHGGTGAQGYTQTGGAIDGNVAKWPDLSVVAPNRIEFPLGTEGSALQRPFAITFNTPSVDVGLGLGGGPNTGMIELVASYNNASPLGTNGLPVATTDSEGNDLNIGRYPDFHWSLSSSPTISPSVDYDIEFRAEGYANFANEDVERMRAIRRQDGATTNFWILTSPTPGDNDNFAVTITEPVAVARNAVGAINADGVLFTFGLEQNMVATNPAAVVLNAGNTEDIDLTAVFSGGDETFTYAITSGDSDVATGADAADVLTVTGVGFGETTLTVVATDGFGDTATATVTVTVNAAFAAGDELADQTVNSGAADADVDASGAATGGTSPYGWAVGTSDAAVATATVDGSGVVTVTYEGVGTATITVTVTDAEGDTVVSTFDVTVNASVGVGGALADLTMTEGTSSDVDASGEFSGGTIAADYAYGASSDDEDVASVSVSGATVTVTAGGPYTIVAGAVTGDAAPATVTVTGTDDLGESASSTFTVDVNPVAGNVDGTGGPSPDGASLALDSWAGAVTLTAKQLIAADVALPAGVDPFDAATIFAAFFNAKDAIIANVDARIEFGEVVREGNMVHISLMVTGDISDVVSVGFEAFVDPAFAKIQTITSELGEGWIVRHVTDDEGNIRIGLAGLGSMTADGVVATMTLSLNDASVEFSIGAEGAVNGNPVASIDALEVVQLPEAFVLQGNYPNPFNPTTTVQFDLPETADVEVQIFDMIGRRVMVLPATTIQAGAKRSVQLNASQLASGTYFYRVIAKMESKTLVETGRMMLVK